MYYYTLPLLIVLTVLIVLFCVNCINCIIIVNCTNCIISFPDPTPSCTTILHTSQNHDFFLNQKIRIFYLNQFFFKNIHIFTIFSLYYAVKHQCINKIVENLSSIVSCTLHWIKVPEPVTVKSVIEEVNKLEKVPYRNFTGWIGCRSRFANEHSTCCYCD